MAASARDPRQRLEERRAKLQRLADDHAAAEGERATALDKIAGIDAMLAEMGPAPAQPRPRQQRSTAAPTPWGFMRVHVTVVDHYGHTAYEFDAEVQPPSWTYTFTSSGGR